MAFDYSGEQYEADEARLIELIRSVERADEFPLTDEARNCRFCTYRSLCDRGEAGRLEMLEEFGEGEGDDDIVLDFDQIAEIEF